MNKLVFLSIIIKPIHHCFPMSPSSRSFPKQVKRNSKRTNSQMNPSQNQKCTPNANICHCVIRHQRENEAYNPTSALSESPPLMLGAVFGGTVPMTFLQKLREVSEDPASARYESTTKEMETVEPRVHPNPITPKNTVGAIHGSLT